VKYLPSVQITECNLCSGSDFETIRTRDRYGLPTNVQKCLDCGLRFINPRMTDGEYADFYRNGTYRRLLEELSGQPFDPEAIEKQQEQYSDWLVQRLSPFMGDHATLLDVGGATGLVAETVATAFGMDPTVLEPCGAELDAAASRANMEVIEGVLGSSTSELESGTFDLVLLCRTVEHLTDIRSALREIRRLLSSGGLFFVDIAKGSQAKVDHCFYLDQSTMERYLIRAGFVNLSTDVQMSRQNPTLPKRISFVARNP